MVKNNLRVFAIPGRGIHRCSVHGVAAWRVSTIRPVHQPVVKVEIQIDRLGQAIEEEFDVSTIRRILSLRRLQVCAKDSALASVVIAFLSPVELSVSSVNRDTYTPVSGVTHVGFAMAGFDERLDI